MKYANIQQSIVRKKQNMFFVIPFMKRMVFVGFVIIGLVFVGAGCGLTKDDSGDTDNQETSQSENGDSGNQTDKNDQDNDQDNIGEIDTSDWKTYRNEEYGFEVRYPENRNLNNKYYGDEAEKIIKFERSQNDFITIKITEYNLSPQNKEEAQTAMELTRDTLDRLKKYVEENINTEISKDFLINKNIGYNVPGGTYSIEYSFFIGKDYIQITDYLQVNIFYKWPDEKDLIKKKIEEIEQRNESQKVLNQLDTIDAMIRTLIKI